MRFDKCILLVMSVFLILFVSMSSLSAADNETQILDMKDNSNEGTFSDLAVEIASGGDINLTKSSYTYDSGSTIQINKKGTIDGKGAIIDMAGSDIGVFNVNVEGVTLKNLTIKNTFANATIFSQNFLNVENCNFINNSASYGGALSLLGGGNVLNCNFISNSADVGGALYAQSGSISGCNFTDNSAVNHAGAVFLFRGSVENCGFVNNSASGYGGAAYITSANVSGCNFTANHVNSEYGGALFLNDGEIIYCNFNENSALDHGGAVYINLGNVSESDFTANHVNGTAGALHINSGNVNGCSFADNYASQTGGAVYVLSRGKIDYSNFSSNSANMGGAVFFEAYGDVEHCNFTDNCVSYYGGAVYLVVGNVSICNFSNNSADFGGAVYLSLGNVSICSFSNNSAIYNGGSIYSAYSEVEYCDFAENHAYYGGAVFLVTGDMSNCEFISNSASYGSSVFISSGNVSDSNFLNNSADTAGALYISSGNIINCGFVNNSAQYGGGIYAVNASIEYVNFTSNAAAADGGAVYCMDKAYVADSIFTNNSASNGGAVFFNNESHVVKCNFINNSALMSSLGGGALTCMDESTVEYCNFFNNSVSHYGGAICFLKKSELKNSDFINNSASKGGAVDMNSGNIKNCNFLNNSAREGGALSFVSDIQIEYSNFLDNRADSGSAILKLSNYNTSDIISNSKFLNNRAHSNSLNITKNESIISVVFTGNDNYLNAITSVTDLTFKNVVYWGADGVMNTDSGTYYHSYRESGQNITVIINNTGEIEEFVKITDANGSFSFDLGEIRGAYIITVKHDEDSYYCDCESVLEFSTRIPSSTNITALSEYIIQANVTQNATGNLTFVIRNLKGEIVKRQSVRMLNSTAAIDIFGLDAGQYNITAYYEGDRTYDSSNDSMIHEISKLSSIIIIQSNNITAGEIEVINTYINNRTSNYTLWINGIKYDMNDTSLTLNSLSGGIYHVTAVFDGDGLYNPVSNSTVFEVLRHDVSMDASDVIIDVGETAKITVETSKELADQNISIMVNGIFRNSPVDKDGKAIAEFTNLLNGTYDVVISYSGNENYSANRTNSKIYVNKVNPSITSNNISAVVGNSVTVNFTAPDDRNAVLLVNVDGVDYAVKAINGSASLTVTDLAAGNYSVDVTYLENDKYVSRIFNDISTISIDKTLPEISISTKDIRAGENEDILIVLPADASGDILVRLNEKIIDNYTKNENIISISQPIHKSGNYSLSVSLINDTKYFDSNKTSSFEAFKVDDYMIIADASDVVFGESSTLVLILPQDMTGDVIINNKSYSANETKYPITLDCENSTGNKSVEIICLGDDKYMYKNSTVFYVVDKAPSQIRIDVNDTYLVGEEITIYLTPINSTGQIFLSVDGIDYEVLSNTVIIPNGLENATHTIIAKLSGDDNYLESINTSVFKVNRFNSTVEILVSNLVKFYSGPERLSVNVTENGNPSAGKNVIFTINGITYSRLTNDNGVASIAINLASGSYSAIVGVLEYNFTKIVDVLVKPTVYADDVVKIFRNATQYYALFLDGNGNPLVNNTVIFNINGVFYNRTTNASGWAKLNLNLGKGSYILTAFNQVTGEMKSNNITIISRLETSDLTKYYKNDSQFVVRVVCDDGSYAGAGEKVTFNINGVIYERITNETGHVKLNINLSPGQYIITTYYGDCVEGNRINVLPTLSANDLEMFYRDGTKFTARVYDGQGKAFPNQNVIFNINGIFYNRTTDANGDAKLNINLLPGEYIITSSYDGLNIANKITIKS